MDDDVPPWDRPRRFAHWEDAGGVEAADDGPRRGPVLDDWPLPGQPRLHAVPDPEPEAVAAPDAAPEAVPDAPAPTRRPVDPQIVVHPPAPTAQGYWQGRHDAWEWVDTTPRSASPVETARTYLRTLRDTMRELIDQKEARDQKPPWDR